MSDAELRLAGEADLPALERLVHASLGPPPAGWDPGAAARLHRRLERALATDPGGFWLLEDGAGMVGLSVGVKREGVWALTLLGVTPGLQGAGHGRRLMDAALGYGEDCRGFLVAASDDQRAWRTYFNSGFDLIPTVEAHGKVARSRIPALPGVREGGAGDLERCAEIDRAVRGAGRVPDLQGMLELGGRLYLSGCGYAIGLPDRVLVLAAENEGEAAELLWRLLADVPEDGEVWVQWISAAQQWAIRVVLDARLAPVRGDPYFVRGELGPLSPWLPNSAML